MGSSSTEAVIRLELRIALQERSYRDARRCADLLPRLELTERLGLAALAAQEEPEAFDTLVRSWVYQAIEEGLLELKDLRWLVPRLDRLVLLGPQETARLMAVLSHRDPN